MLKGQINSDSKLGKIIINLVDDKNVKNIVEIGTWNGMGSTLCVLFKLRDDQEFYSIELYNNMYNEAKKNLANYIKKDNFKLLNGTIISYDDVFWFEHDNIDFKNDRHAQLWYEKDLENLKKSENVLEQLPEKIEQKLSFWMIPCT